MRIIKDSEFNPKFNMVLELFPTIGTAQKVTDIIKKTKIVSKESLRATLSDIKKRLEIEITIQGTHAMRIK